MAKRTDAEIRSSPYFDHFEYGGSRIQKAMKSGPKKAIFKPVLEAHVVKALMEQDEESLYSLSVAFANGTSIYTGEGKTVRAPQWWNEFAEGKKTGLDQLYKQSAWAFRCIEIRSQALAQIPFQIVAADGETEVEESELGDILEMVNPESNWGDLIAATEADMCIYGSSFWRKIRNKNMGDGGKGAPIYLKRLAPSAVEVVIEDGSVKAFKYGTGPGSKTYIRNDVVYYHSYNPDNELIGLSPLEICKKAIEVEIACDEHISTFFGESHALPSYIFSVETQDQNELKRLATAWTKEYGGQKNTWRTAFVGGGGKPEQIGYSPDELALKEVREESRKSICAALGVPPVLVGAWEAANYATADEQRQSLYTETLIPRAEYLASVVNAELAVEFGEDAFEWEFDQLAIMQEDETSKATRVALLVEKNIIKPEVAAEEMGYDAEDVPEPAPVPEMLLPFVGANNANEKPEEKPASKPDDEDSELSKWRKKALTRLKAGKNPAVVFKSDILPDAKKNYLLSVLEQCDTPEAVDKAFKKAKNWVAYP